MDTTSNRKFRKAQRNHQQWPPEYYDYHASLGLIQCFCNICVKPQTGLVSTSEKESTSTPATTSTLAPENTPAYQSKSCQVALGNQASIDQHLKDAAEILHLRDEIRKYRNREKQYISQREERDKDFRTCQNTINTLNIRVDQLEQQQFKLLTKLKTIQNLSKV